MTNADQFKQGEIEELEADIRYLQNASIKDLYTYIVDNYWECQFCIDRYKERCSRDCLRGVKQWLEQEVQDE